MELYWYIVVIIFIIIKIFFYVCWYRSRQRQLAAYLSNPRNAQIVIVGGRAYLHQMCERQNSSSVWPSWYGVQDEATAGEPPSPPPPTASFTALDMPPPYEAVSGADDLKPPPYSECAQSDEADGASPSRRAAPPSLAHGEDCISEAPPPYTPSLTTPANQRGAPASLNQSRSEDIPV